MKGALLILAAWLAFAGAIQFERAEYVQVAWYWFFAAVFYAVWWTARKESW